MATIAKFEDILAWEKGRELTRLVYRQTNSSPFSRDFGLNDQIRRAAVSITSNIAEGFERDGTKEFVQFLTYAKGSCGEVRSQLYVALDEQYISQETFSDLHQLCIEISKLLNGFISYLNSSQHKGRKYIRETPTQYITNTLNPR